ncbi:VOC family protein [Conyzicola nivalis]|uniref:3-demethylubiquinone-9 3-methyltransferase n=1 Tax=Conyzicola nivalis TaxID=1477021 RepID=A0A916WF89_9MICO|nr:VOC family protein [Conyzicola nivalis]GGA93751.1 putative 3-demethylubiquinone-9 3-methyltransferase [Conyzicola nivalis]
MSSITPFLWFDSQAEEAAEFYVSLFPDSRIVSVNRYPEGGPMPAGTAMSVTFEIDGLEVQALNAGPGKPFTEAISFFVQVETQAEIDRYWDALIANGGRPDQCGWLKDRWGLSWQIVPSVLGSLIGGPDPERSARAMQAMMGMTKLVIADLEAA